LRASESKVPRGGIFLWCGVGRESRQREFRAAERVRGSVLVGIRPSEGDTRHRIRRTSRDDGWSVRRASRSPPRSYWKAKGQRIRADFYPAVSGWKEYPRRPGGKFGTRGRALQVKGPRWGKRRETPRALKHPGGRLFL